MKGDSRTAESGKQTQRAVRVAGKMAKMSGGVNQTPGHSWASFLKDNTPSSSENVRTEKRRKSGDMHTKLTLEDKPLLGDMPKLEEFATVCCKLCKCPVKMQSVKDHMALRHPDYSAARLREEAERFQVKIMINSIPESLFAAVPSYRSHMLSPVQVTSPVAPCVPDVVDEDTAAVVDMIGSLAPVPIVPPPPPPPEVLIAPPLPLLPPAPAVELCAPPPPPPPLLAVKEEPPELTLPPVPPLVLPPVTPVQELQLGGVQVVSSEEPLGAVLSLKTEVVPGAFVDILNEFESDETAAAVAAITPQLSPPPPPLPVPVPPVLAPPPAPAPEPPVSVFSPPAAPAASPAPRVPSKAEFKSVPSSPAAARPLTDTAEASSISEHFAKMRAAGSGGGGSLCSKKSRIGHQPRQYDPRKHCGVWITERQKNCTRVLDCRQHNLEQKSKVLRPVPFKDLLARFKAGKSRERDTIKPTSMRYDSKFPPPDGHPAAAAAVSPSRQGGMVTYHNITNSPVFRRDRSSSADDDGMPPPAGVPRRASAASGGASSSSARPPPPPAEACVPRIASHPQPLAVGGALHLSSRGGALRLVDQTSQLRAAFRSMFQPARRGQQSLLKMNQTRVPSSSSTSSHTHTGGTLNGQLTPSKRPPESPSAAAASAAAVKKQRTAAAAAARPASVGGGASLSMQQSGTAAAVSAVLAAAAANRQQQPHQPQQVHNQQQPQQQPVVQQQQPVIQQQTHYQHQQPALLSLQPGGRNVTLGQVAGLPAGQQVNIQLPKGGLPSNIRLTLPSSALQQLQGISNDAKMIAINSNKVPINRMGASGGGGGAAVSLGQRVARIGTQSALPVHHLPQQVLGQIQMPRLPGSAAGLTLKVQQQGGLVMRPEQS